MSFQEQLSAVPAQKTSMSQSFGEHAENTFEKIESVIAKATGTKKGEENLALLTGCFALLIGASFAAGDIPNPLLAEVATVALAALGGATSGLTWSPFSLRREQINRSNFLQGLHEETEQIKPEMIAPYLRDYPELIKPGDVRKLILGRPSAYLQSDGRYRLLQILVDNAKSKISVNLSPKQQRRVLRQRVSSLLADATVLAQIDRSEPEYMQEAVRERGIDLGIGSLAGGGLALAVNHLIPGHHGAFIGCSDEALVWFSTVLAIVKKRLQQKQHLPLVKPSRQYPFKEEAVQVKGREPSLSSSIDQRRHIEITHGTQQRRI
ncbi:MAG TPA: hypothetical protein VGT05_04760 [Patescibacteria group bacterium]|nr:hypothetical protein [Patescibacteria group bacterium]